jgi:hypothetical protein
MKRLAWLFISGLACAGFAACGGAEQSQLFNDSGQTPEQDATQPDTSTGPDAGPTKDTGPSQDVTPIPDVVTVDVPVGPPDSKIHCGNTTCSAQTEVCCVTIGNPNTYACVGSVNDCNGTNDVPIACSSADNCASQGNAGYICCGSPNGPPSGNPSCNNFSTASQVQCQATCDAQQGEFEVGCSTQLQNCSDTQQQCITSQCTLPGYTLCI